MLTQYKAEWDKYFPIEQNTGDLNIPDFNLAEFTGGYSGASMDPTFGATTSGINIPSAQDLADVNFTPTYFAEGVPPSQQQNLQNLYNR